jgi:MFS family permease
MPTRVLMECIMRIKLANHVWNLSLRMDAKKLGRYCDASLVAKCGPSGLYLVVSSVGLRCKYLAALLTVHQPRGLAYCIGQSYFISRSRCKVACRLRYINLGSALRLRSRFFINHGKTPQQRMANPTHPTMKSKAHIKLVPPASFRTFILSSKSIFRKYIFSMSPNEQPSRPSSRASDSSTVATSIITTSTESEVPKWVVDKKFSRPTLPPSLPSCTPSMAWKRGPGFWRSFIAICIPLLFSALEGSVTNTALPTIADALDLGTNFFWAATAFLLASTIFQPVYSQLGDMWGRKHPMMLAVAVFAVGSAICGGTQSAAVFIFGRILHGLGTGGIDLFAEMIVCDIIPLRKRGPYLAIKHITFAIGTTLGPLLRGVFAEHGWRWCFLINMPICAISLVTIWFYLNVDGGANSSEVILLKELKKIDCIGSSMLTASAVMILVALSTGGAPKPWSDPVIVIPIVLGVLGLAAFAFWKRSKYCAHPIMPPSVFSNRTTNIAFALTTIHGFLTYGFQFYLPPYFQAVHVSSPSQSGIEVMPTTLIVVVLAAVGGLLLSFGENTRQCISSVSH